jgi:hypothetical protein
MKLELILLFPVFCGLFYQHTRRLFLDFFKKKATTIISNTYPHINTGFIKFFQKGLNNRQAKHPGFSV